jgi:hypothetical protein
MSQSNRPTKKLTLSPDQFNALYATLLYFIGTESAVGATEFSRSAAKVKAQIERYGRFAESANPADSAFIIYYFDSEVLQILKLLAMHNAMKSSQSQDYFTQLARQKKSKA